jgi:hypothetical protein
MRLNQFYKLAIVWSINLLFAIVTNTAAAKNCKQVQGEFYSTLVYEGCQSPVGICTDGTLIGGLKSSYDFTMQNLYPIDPQHNPSLFAYQGQSTMVLINHGGATLTGTDSGTLHYNPTAGSPFAAVIAITGGTGVLENATGSLNVTGSISFIEGVGHGLYEGTICKSKEHENDPDDAYNNNAR